MEKQLLAAIAKDRRAYTTTLPFLKEEDFSPRGWEIFTLFNNYYTKDVEATTINLDTVKEQVERLKPKHYDEFAMVLDSLADVSVPNFLKLFIDFKKDAAKNRLASALVSGQDEEEHLSTYLQLRDADSSLDDLEESTVYVGQNLSDILNQTSGDNLIKIYPSILNDRVGGGVPKQSNILLFAPTEMGKSAFAINMGCGFVSNGVPTLYVGNEDPANMMLMRFYNRLTGMTRQEIRTNPDKAYELAMDRGYGNLAFASLAPGTLEDIRHLQDKYGSQAIIIDQLPNLAHKGTDGVDKLDKLAKGTRQLAKEKDIVIVSLAQAGDSAEGKLKLGIGDVYFSNVALQAQMDVMLGMGADETFKNMNRRMISICKNKLSGDHREFIVQIDEGLSKITAME